MTSRASSRCTAHTPQDSALSAGCIPCTTKPNGYTLIELLIALALSALLFVGLGSVLGQVLDTREAVHGKNDLIGQARFAMQQMVRAVSRSPHLLLPLNDNPLTTDLTENIREQTVPASAPETGSTLATGVLAVTLDTMIDLDGDDTPDADNDGDGRFDEDLPDDMNNDFGAGIWEIDDDGDGDVDESLAEDDDEYFFTADEDPINGIDDDGDNNVDEDASSDMNGDGCPGNCGVDDDGDGLVDEGGDSADDDEDGQSDEDWYDPVVFYLAGGTLMHRIPVPWDETANGFVSGRDFIEEPIAENVTRFRVERIPQDGDRMVTVDLTLALTSPVTGETASLNTRIRVGSAL